MNTRNISFGNWLLILIVLYLSYQLLFTSSHWIILDNLNLIIHEAGHLLFSSFGQFMQMLGGSLLQILFPCAFLLYFWLQREYFSVSFVLFWVADNIINVSIYMRDAQSMFLPLVGGEGAIHDWNWLFSTLGVLSYTQQIGTTVYILGIILLLSSIIGMTFLTLVKNLPQDLTNS